jgi:hypothetical protein
MQSPPRTANPPGASRIGVGCLIFFALLAAGGSFALFVGIRGYATDPNAIAAIIAGAVFTLLGVLLMIGTWYGNAAAAKVDAERRRG